MWSKVCVISFLCAGFAGVPALAGPGDPDVSTLVAGAAPGETTSLVCGPNSFIIVYFNVGPAVVSQIESNQPCSSGGGGGSGFTESEANRILGGAIDRALDQFLGDRLFLDRVTRDPDEGSLLFSDVLSDRIEEVRKRIELFDGLGTRSRLFSDAHEFLRKNLRIENAPEGLEAFETLTLDQQHDLPNFGDEEARDKQLVLREQIIFRGLLDAAARRTDRLVSELKELERHLGDVKREEETRRSRARTSERPPSVQIASSGLLHRILPPAFIARQVAMANLPVPDTLQNEIGGLSLLEIVERLQVLSPGVLSDADPDLQHRMSDALANLKQAAGLPDLGADRSARAIPSTLRVTSSFRTFEDDERGRNTRGESFSVGIAADWEVADDTILTTAVNVGRSEQRDRRGTVNELRADAVALTTGITHRLSDGWIADAAVSIARGDFDHRQSGAEGRNHAWSFVGHVGLSAHLWSQDGSDLIGRVSHQLSRTSVSSFIASDSTRNSGSDFSRGQLSASAIFVERETWGQLHGRLSANYDTIRRGAGLDRFDVTAGGGATVSLSPILSLTGSVDTTLGRSGYRDLGVSLQLGMRF